jgi:hypothetical protein
MKKKAIKYATMFLPDLHMSPVLGSDIGEPGKRQWRLQKKAWKSLSRPDRELLVKIAKKKLENKNEKTYKLESDNSLKSVYE